VIWYSCITSSSALCVLAGARLISSASRTWVNAGDVGRHHVGRELHAGVRERQRLRHRPHQQGLAQSGHAFDEDVARRGERDEDLIDDLRLADHRVLDRRAEAAEEIGGAGESVRFNVFHAGPSCE
jgi:hypothetical protein